MNILETEQIQGYGFADFLEKIEKMINQGWQLDFSTNDNYPTSFGTFYSVGMIKVEKEAKGKRLVRVRKGYVITYCRPSI